MAQRHHREQQRVKAIEKYESLSVFHSIFEIYLSIFRHVDSGGLRNEVKLKFVRIRMVNIKMCHQKSAHYTILIIDLVADK